MKLTSIGLVLGAGMLAGCAGSIPEASAGCMQRPECPPPVAEYHQPPVHHHARSTHHVRHEYHRQVTHEDATPPASRPCVENCAVDLVATFIECVDHNGRQVWRYRTERGTYSMSVDRRNPNDMIRLHPDGHVDWASVRS